MLTVLIVIAVAALVVLLVRGLWSATAVRKGTGCPCCDRAMGHTHEHEAADGKQHSHDKAAGAKS